MKIYQALGVPRKEKKTIKNLKKKTAGKKYSLSHVIVNESFQPIHFSLCVSCFSIFFLPFGVSPYKLFCSITVPSPSLSLSLCHTDSFFVPKPSSHFVFSFTAYFFFSLSIALYNFSSLMLIRFAFSEKVIL